MGGRLSGSTVLINVYVPVEFLLIDVLLVAHPVQLFLLLFQRVLTVDLPPAELLQIPLGRGHAGDVLGQEVGNRRVGADEGVDFALVDGHHVTEGLLEVGESLQYLIQRRIGRRRHVHGHFLLVEGLNGAGHVVAKHVFDGAPLPDVQVLMPAFRRRLKRIFDALLKRFGGLI